MGISDYAKDGVSIRPDEYAATVTGISIDRRPPGMVPGFDSAVLFAWAGDVEGSPTSFTVDVKLQHAKDDGTGQPDSTDWADVSGETLATINAANQTKRKAVVMVGLKRHIRLVGTISFTGGTTPNVALTAGFVLGGADVLPV